MDERTNCLLCLCNAINAMAPVGASYYNATRSLADSEGTTFNNTFGDPRERLQCATLGDTDCGSDDGDEIFINWSLFNWNFGSVGADTLPALRNSPPCRSGQGDCRLLP